MKDIILLDYYAAKALQAYISNPVEMGKVSTVADTNEKEADMLSIAAYRQALSMLKLRGKFIDKLNLQNQILQDKTN